MRIAGFFDIHGNLPRAKGRLARSFTEASGYHRQPRRQSFRPLQPAETEFLMTQPWVQLAGNHERQLLEFAPDRAGFSDRYAHSQLSSEAFAWMAKLLPTQLLNKDVFLCHGTPQSDSDYRIPGTLHKFVRRRRMKLKRGSVQFLRLSCYAGIHISPEWFGLASGQLLVKPGQCGVAGL